MLKHRGIRSRAGRALIHQSRTNKEEMVKIKCDICKEHARLLHPLKTTRTITKDGIPTTETEIQYVCRQCYDRLTAKAD
ncbi:MAG: hypothetical protein ACFE7I_09895 [Candidatus Hodarchaeota archaeon]